MPYEDMTPEEAQYILKQSPPKSDGSFMGKVADVTGSVARGIDSVVKSAPVQAAQSFNVGGSNGVVETLDSWTLYAKELLDGLGISNPESTKPLKRGIEQARQQREESRLSQDYPGVAATGEFVGNLVPYTVLPGGKGKLAEQIMLRGGSTLAKIAASKVAPKVIGAIPAGTFAGAASNEQDRLTGAATGALTTIAGGYAMNKLYNKLPVRNAKLQEVADESNVRLTRDATLGRDLRPDKIKGPADKLAEFEPVEDMPTLSQGFETLLQKREEGLTLGADKLIDKAFKGKAGKQLYRFRDVQGMYSTLRDGIAQSAETSPAAQAVLNTLDSIFSKPQSLRFIKDMTASNGRLSKLVDRAKGEAGEIFESVKSLRDALRKGTVKRLLELNPEAAKLYEEGVSMTRHKIQDVLSEDISKAVRSGDFDAIVTQLQKANGAKVYDALKKAVGPVTRTGTGPKQALSGMDLVEAGILKSVFNKSYKNFKANPVGFVDTLAKIRKGSGFKFSKTMNAAIDDMSYMFKHIVDSAGNQGKIQLEGKANVLAQAWNWMLDRPSIIKLTTRAMDGTPANIRALRLMNSMLRTTLAGSTQNKNVSEFDTDSMTPEEAQYILGQGKK